MNQAPYPTNFRTLARAPWHVCGASRRDNEFWRYYFQYADTLSRMTRIGGWDV
jgi:hypothetical protein